MSESHNNHEYTNTDAVHDKIHSDLKKAMADYESVVMLRELTEALGEISPEFTEGTSYKITVEVGDFYFDQAKRRLDFLKELHQKYFPVSEEDVKEYAEELIKKAKAKADLN